MVASGGCWQQDVKTCSGPHLFYRADYTHRLTLDFVRKFKFKHICQNCKDNYEMNSFIKFLNKVAEIWAVKQLYYSSRRQERVNSRELRDSRKSPGEVSVINELMPGSGQSLEGLIPSSWLSHYTKMCFLFKCAWLKIPAMPSTVCILG